LADKLKDEELSLDRIGLPTPAEFATLDATDKDCNVRTTALQGALIKLQPVNLTRLAAMIEKNDSMARKLQGKEVRVRLNACASCCLEMGVRLNACAWCFCSSFFCLWDNSLPLVVHSLHRSLI
jgi:hypothetical protein